MRRVGRKPGKSWRGTPERPNMHFNLKTLAVLSISSSGFRNMRQWKRFWKPTLFPWYRTLSKRDMKLPKSVVMTNKHTASLKKLSKPKSSALATNSQSVFLEYKWHRTAVNWHLSLCFPAGKWLRCSPLQGCTVTMLQQVLEPMTPWFSSQLHTP